MPVGTAKSKYLLVSRKNLLPYQITNKNNRVISSEGTGCNDNLPSTSWSSKEIKLEGHDDKLIKEEVLEEEWLDCDRAEYKLRINEVSLKQEQSEELEERETKVMNNKKEDFDNVVSVESKTLNNDDLSCQICGRTMHSIKHKVNHMQFEHTAHFDMTSAGYFKCKLCALRTKNKLSMRMHVRKRHKIEYSCSICETMFPDKLSLNDHFTKLHPPAPGFLSWSCYKCGKIFKRNTELMFHKRSMHTQYFDMIGKNDYKCKLCQQVLNSKKRILHHVMSTHRSTV